MYWIFWLRFWTDSGFSLWKLCLLGEVLGEAAFLFALNEVALLRSDGCDGDIALSSGEICAGRLSRVSPAGTFLQTSSVFHMISGYTPSSTDLMCSSSRSNGTGLLVAPYVLLLSLAFFLFTTVLTWASHCLAVVMVFIMVSSSCYSGIHSFLVAEPSEGAKVNTPRASPTTNLLTGQLSTS